MFKHSIAVALLAVSCGVASPAFAQEKAYIGGAFGSSKISNWDCTGATSCDDSHTGNKVYLGYKFHPNFAGEIGYMNVGKATASDDFVGVELKGSGVTIGVAGFLPFSDKFTGVGRVGLLASKVYLNASVPAFGWAGSYRESHTVPYIGAGVGYAVTPQLTVELAVDTTKLKLDGVDSSNATLWSVGARFAF